MHASTEFKVSVYSRMSRDTAASYDFGISNFVFDSPSRPCPEEEEEVSAEHIEWRKHSLLTGELVCVVVVVDSMRSTYA